MSMSWQRPTTNAPRPECKHCKEPALYEYTTTRQCEPGDLAYWEPRCFFHRKLMSAGVMGRVS